MLITDEDKVSFAFIECVKSIRTKIENLASNKGFKTFIVTSTYENEGKTTVAINIATSLAQKGKSVLLMDADLRKPAVLRTIGVKYDDKSGLIPIIKGEATYQESIKYVKSLGLFILPSGGITQKSSEVLDADKVRQVIEQARKEFDFIIIDTPPSRVVSDSLVISALADSLAVSAPYLSKLFHEQTGSSPSKYLTDIRMRQARKLLMDTNLTVKEIAVRVGFPDPFHFSRSFRNAVGISPVQFREELAAAGTADKEQDHDGKG